MHRAGPGQILLKLYSEAAYLLYIPGEQNSHSNYNIMMKITIPPEIQEWAFWLGSGLIGEEKLPLCPWAKKSILEGSVDFWEEENPVDLVPLPEDIKVRIVHLPGRSLEDLIRIRDLCNSEFGDFIFLDSHPDDPETIGGVKSVSSLPLILIQRRKEIEEARKILEKGNYYKYWDPEVLNRMLNI